MPTEEGRSSDNGDSVVNAVQYVMDVLYLRKQSFELDVKDVGGRNPDQQPTAPLAPATLSAATVSPAAAPGAVTTTGIVTAVAAGEVTIRAGAGSQPCRGGHGHRACRGGLAIGHDALERGIDTKLGGGTRVRAPRRRDPVDRNNSSRPIG